MTPKPIIGRKTASLFKWSAMVGLVILIGLTRCSTKEEKVPTSDETGSSHPEGDTIYQHIIDDAELKPVEAVKPLFSYSETREDEENKNDSLFVEESQPVEEAPGIYIQASPMRGFNTVYEYLANELRTPAEALAAPIEEIVTVSFIISAEGKAVNIELDKTLDEAFETELKRVIANMPQWRAATLDGNPVPSKVVLPLDFRP